VTQLYPVAVTLVALTLTATACGSGGKEGAGSPQDQIQVTGTFREKPTIRFKTPLNLSESSSWVTVPGKGDMVGPEATVILQLTLTNGRTGKKAISTLDPGQRPLDIPLGDQVFPSLAKALIGKPDHTRVVVASTSDDAYGPNGSPQLGLKGGDPVVMVADILSTDPASVLKAPTGASTPAPATAPTLVEKDGQPTGFDFSKARKPKKLVVIPLREGTGPEVESPDRLAVDYVVQVWGARTPVEGTYGKEPTTVSLGTSAGVIKAWTQALVGRKEGARLMIIAPPDVAYGAAPRSGIPGNSTLAFIVDVLGVG
jgi:peptidylprolyl isomerase